MSATAKPFNPDSPEGNLRPIIRYNPVDRHQKEMVEALWVPIRASATG